MYLKIAADILMNYFLEHIRLDDNVNCLLAEDSHKISSVISMVQINKNFGHKIVNIFLSISLNICFGVSLRVVGLTAVEN